MLQEGAYAYLGMTVADFPNFLMLYGPNTNLGHNSIICMIESQIHYIVAFLTRLDHGDFHAVEIKEPVQDEFNLEIQQRLQGRVWAAGCTSWHLTASRKNTANWASDTFEYWRRTRAPDWSNYAIH